MNLNTKKLQFSFSSKVPREVTLKAIMNSSNSTVPSLLSSNVVNTNLANFAELPCKKVNRRFICKFIKLYDFHNRILDYSDYTYTEWGWWQKFEIHLHWVRLMIDIWKQFLVGVILKETLISSKNKCFIIESMEKHQIQCAIMSALSFKLTLCLTIL